MKLRAVRLSFCAAIACALGFLAGGVHASPIADGFVTGSGHYSVAALSGQNPFVPGFTSSWNQGTGSTKFAVSSTGLTAATPTYETGGSVTFTGTTGDAAGSIARNVTIPSSTTFYMSGIFNRGNSNAINPGAYALMGWGNTIQPTLATSGSTLQGVYMGYAQSAATSSGTGAPLDDFGSLVIRTRQNIGGANEVVDTVLVDGQAFSTFSVTYFVVAKLVLNTSGSNDTLTYWLNPTSLSSDANMSSTAETSGTVTVSTASASTDFQRLTFASSGWDGTMSFDEPRITTNIADLSAATPTPEPGAGFVAIVAGLWGTRRKRRG